MPRQRKPSIRRQGDPSAGFLLERRSAGAAGKAGTGSKTGKADRKDRDQVAESDIRPLGVDAFIEILNRYCRRFSRDGRNFSLASLRILEYESVKATAGFELADQLDHLGANIICSALRGEDRICLVGKAQYLVLMPGTIYDDAHKAMERASLSIGEKSLRQKNHVVRPSATFMVASCSDVGGNSGGVTGTLVATETLLREVGYALGSNNALIDRSLRESIVNSGDCSVFTGSYETWFDRYKAVGERLIDTWSADDREIVLSVWQPASDTVSGVNRESLLRRLRALQSIDHPAFNRVTDFFITPDWKISLISSKLDGVELRGGPVIKKTKTAVVDSLQSASDLTILNWIIQISNALIAAQAMSLPMVLSDFSKIKITLLQNERIVLSGFESEYLQSAFEELPKHDHTGKKPHGFISDLALFGLELVEAKDEARSGSRKRATKPNFEAPLGEFRDLLASLSSQDGNCESSSLYKLRSTLRSIQEAGL